MGALRDSLYGGDVRADYQMVREAMKAVTWCTMDLPVQSTKWFWVNHIKPPDLCCIMCHAVPFTAMNASMIYWCIIYVYYADVHKRNEIRSSPMIMINHDITIGH